MMLQLIQSVEPCQKNNQEKNNYVFAYYKDPKENYWLRQAQKQM